MRTAEELRRLDDEHEYQRAFGEGVKRASMFRESVLKATDMAESDVKAYVIEAMSRERALLFKSGFVAAAARFPAVADRLEQEKAIIRQAESDAIEFVFAPKIGEFNLPTPDDLGRIVREAWVRWAKTQPNPKPHWLLPYDELSEPDKEADRQIGMAVVAAIVSEALHVAAAIIEEASRP